MAQSRAAAGPSWSLAGTLLWPLRRMASSIRATVVVSVLLICGSFVAAGAIQMRNDRIHALAQAASFDSRRAEELALDLGAELNRYAAIGSAFATATTTAETSAALSEAGGKPLRNIAVLDIRGELQSELTGSPKNFLPLPAEILDAARVGRAVIAARDGKSFAIIFGAGPHIVAVELDARNLLPSASVQEAVLSTLSGEVVALGREWRALPDAEELALRDEMRSARVVEVADGRRLIALNRVKGWPLAVGASSRVGEALGAWYGALPLYFFLIFGPALAGAGLAVVFVREFERRVRTAEAMKNLRATSSGDAKLFVRLAEAERRAAEAERSQRDFLGHMSHELRTPLNAIIGFSELIERGVFGHHRKYAEYARDIGTAGRDLHDKIGDILDYSDIESGKREFALEPVDVVPVLREIVDATAEAARDRGIRLTITFPTIAQGVADLPALRRIVGHLVDNALRYSPAGGTVRLQVRTTDAAVVIGLRDQGLGFAPHELARVGEPFSRFDRPGAETGAGMGLAVAKILAERMGARLRLSSAAGEGTLVELWLKTAQPVSGEVRHEPVKAQPLTLREQLQRWKA